MARKPKLSDREQDALSRSRLSELKQATADYFAGGGTAIKVKNDGTVKYEYFRGSPLKNIYAATTTLSGDPAGRSLFRDLQNYIGGLGGEKGRQSGFKVRQGFATEASQLLDQLSNGGFTKGQPFVLPKLAEQQRNRKTKQLTRDATVASQIANQRNALAKRRNVQLTPGNASELNLRAKSLFAERRRGVIY